jgi:hypothetical protein
MRIAVLFLSFCCVAFGDGGTLLFRTSAGLFDVTVFSKADPVRVGMNDFSVLVEKHDAHTTVMDAKVLLHLTRSENGEITRVTSIATHEKATNKMLYAGTINVPKPGAWKLGVDLSDRGETALAAANITVNPPAPPVANYWPYIAMVPCLGLAMFLNRWLKKKMGVRRRW